MIKANELRIGNFVIEDGDIVQVDAGLFYWLINQNHGRPSAFTQIEPIPLTPEILKKAGFVNIERLLFCKGSFRIKQNLKSYFYDTDSYRIKLGSLHQLQNLYFALTGKELSVSL